MKIDFAAGGIVPLAAEWKNKREKSFRSGRNRVSMLQMQFSGGEIVWKHGNKAAPAAETACNAINHSGLH
ncbi:MAG: hypothetical protein U9Q79_01415 [Candidatus Hydrogenedentes bacterium]|nr:hypothetical protein [Candidatus Hydrogenedentota bacterium]